MEVSEPYSPNAQVLIGQLVLLESLPKRAFPVIARLVLIFTKIEASAIGYVTTRAHIKSRQMEHRSRRPELEKFFFLFFSFAPPVVHQRQRNKM